MNSKSSVKNESKKLTIITIAMVIILVIIFAGVTYAFFTANNPEGSTAQIISETGRMVINYDDGTDIIQPVTGIVPSNAILVNKTFTLTGSNTTVGMKPGDGLSMPYKVGVQYTSTFSDGMMHYYIKEVNRPTNSNVTANYVITPEPGKTEDDYKNQTLPGNDTYTGYTHGTFKNGKKYTEMVTGEFPASLNDQTITFNLIIQFPDNNENQDSEKGKTFNGKVVVNYEPKYISTYLTKLDKTKNGLEVDETTDKNLRYVGASPKNYLKFNDEIWRIIGVFNNITTIDEQENEKTESLVKIVRNDSLGNYSWDSSESSINSGWGVNEWSQADLMYELNCDGSGSKAYCRDDITEGYLSNLTTGSTTWYNGSNNAKNGPYEYRKNIKSKSIDKIAKVKWNLGGYNTNSASALNMYNAERGTLHVINPSDGITRTNTWDGKIALIYPSDYGYASTNEACRNKLNSQTNDVSNCKNENWLFNSANQWTLSPYSGGEDHVFSVASFGIGYHDTASSPYGVRPALFLKSDVVIAGGTGESIENAYTLE